MKKLLIIAACMVATAPVFAQSVHFGLKGGLNVASVSADNGLDYSSRTSFYLGGLAHIHVSEHFAVQPELYYSGQGAKRNGQTAQLGYINLPVLGQYMFGNGFRLQTGPQLGVLVSAKTKSGDTKSDVKDDFNDIDFSWAFGGSYQFPGSGAGIDARYNLGLNNIYNAGSTLHNRVFSIGMFYQFVK
jgi:hypothetical protein